MMIDRPSMPDGYGADTATAYVDWGHVEIRLSDALHYWVSTTRPDGRPHVVPRWGVWLDHSFWYDGSPLTRHVMNLEENPHCVLHLEDGRQAVIVEGTSHPSPPVSAGFGERLAAEFARKYAPDYTPAATSWSDEVAGGLRFLVPSKALAWTRFPHDLTRFRFDA